MRESLLDLAFPAKGLNTSSGLANQPPGTTPKASNVRYYDARSGRDRGGQRPGLAKYCPQRVSGPNLIQFIGRLVYTGAGTTLSPREVRGIAVSQGDVLRFDSSVVTPITGGTAALSGSAKLIFAAQIFQNLYFADGANFKYYAGATNNVLTLTASAGSLPTDSGGNKPRLVAPWRTRLVWSGLPLDGNNWFMAKAGDPTNYNYTPATITDLDAVAGNNSTAGFMPDVITCLLPYSDEILVMGGDHTIYQMNGDPQVGGSIDLLTESIGMAWGEPYCRDGSGNLYIFSSRGSVYRMVVGQALERISDPVANQLMSTNLGTNAVRMAYDESFYGFHVWITPTSGAAATNHYFCDIRSGAWWQDSYASNNHNPLAVHTYDGDSPDDRVTLIGGWDGYIRKESAAAVDDDGTAIDSVVYLGPLRDKAGSSLLLADLECTLDVTSGSLNYSVLPGSYAQEALSASPRFSGSFGPGRNRSQAVRSAAHAHYVKLESNTNSAWALEWLQARVRTPEGKARQRIW